MLKAICAIVMLFSFSFADSYEGFEDEFTQPVKRYDPLKSYNEAMTRFNDAAYVNVLKPVVKGYNRLIEEDGRVMIDNFFNNLQSPISFINSILQGKFKNSFDILFRFLVNSTLGVGGFGDAGEELFGIKAQKEDFGQTLGYYGMDSGIPIVLPFVGPSNARDVVGFVGDFVSNPITYFKSSYLSFGLKIEDRFNNLSLHVKEIEIARKNAINLYPFMQGAYENIRYEAIKK